MLINYYSYTYKIVEFVKGNTKKGRIRENQERTTVFIQHKTEKEVFMRCTHILTMLINFKKGKDDDDDEKDEDKGARYKKIIRDRDAK